MGGACARAARDARLPGWLLGLLLGCAACAQPPAGPVPAGTVRLDVGGVPVDVRVAHTGAQRRAGLAGVERLAPNEGMLFVYPQPERRRFWMKGCLLALDVAFLDADRRVAQVVTLAPPENADAEPQAVVSAQPTAFVLEMAAGFFARHGLGVGTPVGIPTLPAPD